MIGEARYPCRRCGLNNPSYLAFSVGWPRRERFYCLNHIPWWVRFWMWIRRVDR